MRLRNTVLALLLVTSLAAPAAAQSRRFAWTSFGRNPQHTALADVASQPLQRVRWQTPVDLAPQYSGRFLLIHYGSPLATRRNTIVVTVKTGAEGGFRVEGRRGSDGALIWSEPTDYLLPTHDWTPSVGPALASTKVWIPAAGGTLLSRTRVDRADRARLARVAFYGDDDYAADPAAYDATVFINTPLTVDRRGNVYFGFVVEGTAPGGLRSGIGRVTNRGAGSWVSVADASGDPLMRKVPHNSAPAISADQRTVYVAVSDGDGWGNGAGYLVALDAKTLTRKAAVRLQDPKSGNDANINDDGTASPMVGPDGDVYFGVLERPAVTNHQRGWLLHFDAALVPTGAIGAFGWDTTPAVVPAAAVPSYGGASDYLLMTKYNDYAGAGGTGINRVAVLDPNDAVVEPVSGIPAMREVLSIAGPTPDDRFPSKPGAVKEWCMNTAAVDPKTRSVIVNNEDGVTYRWDLTSNTLVQPVRITDGLGQAYTPTIIGPDGTAYAIGNGILFAVGE